MEQQSTPKVKVMHVGQMCSNLDISHTYVYKQLKSLYLANYSAVDFFLHNNTRA